MSKTILLLLTLTCAMGWGVSTFVAADEPSLAEQAQAALAKHKTLSYALPGYPPFQTAEGQKRLELTDEQKGAIRDIGTVFNGKVLDHRQATWDEEREKAEKLTGEAKQKFLDEFWAQEGKRMEERRQWALAARRQVEKVLTEKQRELVREMEFAQRKQYLIQQPQMFDELKLDDKQQAKMKEVREAVAKRQQELTMEMMKNQTEGSEKLVELLTPEQRKTLREQLDKAYEAMIQIR